MYFIKFLEACDDSKIYNGEQSLENAVAYVMELRKVWEDRLRVNASYLICSGCSPFPFNRLEEHDSDSVALLMKVFVKSFYKDFDDVMRHRVISFPASEYVLPSDLDYLGRSLVEYYSRNGFVACYGVHRDTYNYHVHVLVCTVSFQDGHKFNIFRERTIVYEIVNSWNMNLQDKLSDPRVKENYERLLFGDGVVPASFTDIGAVEQIKTYKAYHNKFLK